MFLTPDGNTETVTELLRGKSSEMAKTMRRKALTDKIAYYVATSCMILAIEYYAAGIPLTTDQIKSISRPLMDALKLGGSFPRTMADDYFHTRCGARVPRLSARLDGRDIELNTRLLNGCGSAEFANVGMYLQAATTQAHGYAGDIVAYPHILPETMARSTPGRPGIGQTWLPYIAAVLHKHAVNIRAPHRLNEIDTNIAATLAATPEPPALDAAV
ncbi:hypothetical protein LPJ61_000429 [Coemansia biformis]|uniref:Uncharacterized protein n=1 Tax=Coemansia biformis TaxID=1286918 RepID=A0A9W8CY68_9FUNG|nr:hypothetical protein LPJ61_000429 [Coemansia biformis]